MMKKRILAICMALCMTLSAVPVALAAEEDVDPIKTGYKYGDEYESLPEAPVTKGKTITVTPDNAQYTLDGAYGSISGMTIVFSKGTYGQLVLGRATKYPGSDTEYYIGGFDADKKHDYAEFVELKNAPGYSEYSYYIRNMEDVTLRAEADAEVTIAGMVGVAGHAYGTGDNSPSFDYVLERYSKDTTKGYFLAQNWSKITFENLSFTAQVNIDSSQPETTIDSVTFDNCSFTTGGTASGNGAGLRCYNGWNDGQISGLTVTNCEFDTCFQGIYSSNIKDITVKDNSFTNTGHNAVAIQSGDKGPVDHGEVVITDNIFDGIGDRIIRFNEVAEGTTITLTGNTATDSGDDGGEVIKVGSLPDGVFCEVHGNDWGEGTKVNVGNGGDKLEDPDSIPATSVTMAPATLSLVEGETATLTATVKPAYTTDAVEWTSSDESVATVDDGVVTAVGPGTAIITAAAGGFSDICAVTVEARAVTVTFEGAEDVAPIKVLPGETITLPTPDDTTDQIFRYWTVEGDPVGTRYYGGEEFTANEDITFVANWKDNSYIPIPPTQPTKPAEPDEPDTPDEPDVPDEPDTPDVPASDYADVQEDAWYAEAVDYVTAEGLMTGTTADAFAPDVATTRAMVWTILGRMSGAELSGGEVWYAPAQAWAVSSGVSDGSDPDGKITREQLAAMLYRFAGEPELLDSELAGLSGYADHGDVSSYAYRAMAWAVSRGIINGVDGTLVPQNLATRAQVAAMLMRYRELSK